jgi:putative transposase
MLPLRPAYCRGPKRCWHIIDRCAKLLGVSHSRVYYWLRRPESDWGRENRTATLMRAAGLQARAKLRRLPWDSGVRPDNAIGQNCMDRRFEASAPNQLWVPDFTFFSALEPNALVASLMLPRTMRRQAWPIT